MNPIAATKFSGLLLRQLGTLGSEISRPLGMQWVMMRISMVEGRNLSTLALGAAKEVAGKRGGGDEKPIVSYWGVAPPELTNEDGSPWKWNCFRPWEAYKADMSIDVNKHHQPSNLKDKFACWTVHALKYPTHLFFQVFISNINSNTLLTYGASPKLAHLIVGYLEEEAVKSYSEFLLDLESGAFENLPAPAIAIGYWRMPPDSTLRDVITVIRADEAHHRDVNHFASDIQCQGMELKDYPAPLGYH
ncbi:ubiquinol oxidase 2, mitochondrial-like [Diospyros lotus]|uniref:ubiquinol oxidase 2, mitochondrial-like n=1 Tax=Diospyros lotus TaxID=55363 RepID=UPI00225B25F1|nr:ubiquinol oxidase 2, mitochondrial-like [Diospyros lotus]